MSKVIVDISMSLDGFVNASNVRAEEPMGDGGLVLHEWAFDGDDRDREVLGGGGAGVGAIITGRRTYDLSVPWWGADGPSGPARVPVFVVTHTAPADVVEGGVYTFVTAGPEHALREAATAADGRDMCVMGGADLIQQYLRAGLVDEISIHLVPVLLHHGTRLFEHIGDDHIRLVPGEPVGTAKAVHLRFRVLTR
ncbi:Dihydrofolate reductase [Micromonospora echinaurantiaca]|uniref:Dihydrofolate reductase n=1 Tax=Micromonospora echinaurantiaca TaxID=47857 RepID=A0A1C5I5E0_9ACTN|nr:dihydrofolate reductase family protein [Micromonospora echinaurantiaca]SCG53443.1 Dihydrofolate reductase [Micromonospora echinaurantiaca]